MSSISIRPESRLPSSTHDSITRAGPSYESYSSGTLKPPPDRPSKLRRLRPWSFSSRLSPGRAESGTNPLNRPDPLAQGNGPSDTEVDRIIEPYEQLRVREHEPSNPGESSKPTRPSLLTRPHRSSTQRWSDSEEDDQADSYSWVDNDRSGNGQRVRQGSVSRRISLSEPPSPTGTASRAIRNASRQPVRIPPSPTGQPQRPARLDPTQSYNILLAYQSSYSSHSSSGGHTTPFVSPFASTESGTSKTPDLEWHDLIDTDVRLSLGREEVKRQGLWWELIKGESEYVRDLRIICQSIIEPLRNHEPPLLSPPSRLHAFILEVFSSIPEILRLHEEMLERLLLRQRSEWPLITSATDILLQTILEVVDQYEIYMKNFPFAETRVKRECTQNPRFGLFFEERRNHSELTRRRDISVFLSRPVTRLPRLLLLLDAITNATPLDHPDHEEIPTVKAVLEGVLKGSQPGIESAEAKIKLWDFGENLMFRKGEIIELDIPDPKRTLFHAGYLFRRVRSETNWHGWQDLHAFLLDNYFLLTRDEEQGKHIVVSRPIHIDFLELSSADGTPERRHDYINQVRRRQSGKGRNGQHMPDRLMYPFTISLQAGASSRSYTLCVTSQAAREQWKDKIESAKALRRYDVENNRTFAIHTISVPDEVKKSAIKAADTFMWCNREAVAIALSHTVWIGWRRDSHSYRELVRIPSMLSITTVTVIPDFGWLLVKMGGRLFAFNLGLMMPTHEPSTWVKMTMTQGVELSVPAEEVAFVRLGTTKGRLLVVYATYISRTSSTLLTFQEPLHAPVYNARDPPRPFRLFAQLSVPGFASEVWFFKQTIAVITDRSIMVAEPGNSNYNPIPVLPPSLSTSSIATKLSSPAKAMAMFQTGENEFLLAYEWGACFATRYGEISRNGAFFRWNLYPSYIAFRPPYLLVFDETEGKAEVRHVAMGKMSEVIACQGMRPIRLSRADQALLALTPNGIIEVVETVPL